LPLAVKASVQLDCGGSVAQSPASCTTSVQPAGSSALTAVTAILPDVLVTVSVAGVSRPANSSSAAGATVSVASGGSPSPPLPPQADSNPRESNAMNGNTAFKGDSGRGMSGDRSFEGSKDCGNSQSKLPAPPHTNGYRFFIPPPHVLRYHPAANNNLQSPPSTN